jgi:hypothetical protein
MELLQIESVESPLDDSAIFSEAFRVLCRVQMMGIWDPPAHVHLDPALYASIVRNLQSVGIARGMQIRSQNGSSPSAREWLTAWKSIADAIAESPHPAGEWGPARELLGDELLAEILGISDSSLRRYSVGGRETPDPVAARLHSVGQIASALAGSYNTYGMRRWFDRTRVQLAQRRPKDILVGDWSPDDDEVRQVIDLAESLVGAGSAS